MNEDKLDKICRLLTAIREKYNTDASVDINNYADNLNVVTFISGAGHIVHSGYEEAIERLESHYLEGGELKKCILKDRIIKLREELDAVQFELSQLGD